MRIGVVISTGRPPFKVEELEALGPDRAGESMTFMNQIRRVILFATHMSGLLASRPSVADTRIEEVLQSDPVLCIAWSYLTIAHSSSESSEKRCKPILQTILQIEHVIIAACTDIKLTDVQ